jgi:hypothetical protein
VTQYDHVLDESGLEFVVAESERVDGTDASSCCALSLIECASRSHPGRRVENSIVWYWCCI